MLPKRQRLSTAEFNEYFTRGQRLQGRYCTLVYTPHTRFHGAVVVGKKVYKRAVDRNRLRRRLYPVLRAFAERTNQTGVFQCLTKPAAAATPIGDIRDELRGLLARATEAR